MRYLFTFCLCLAAALMCRADGYRSVAISLSNGSTVQLDLSDELIASFTDTNLVISGGKSDVTVARSQIKSFEFLTSASLAQVGADSQTPVVADGSIHFDNLADGSTVTIAATDGRVLRQASVSGSWSTEIPSAAGSTVIVNVNGTSFKISVR